MMMNTWVLHQPEQCSYLSNQPATVKLLKQVRKDYELKIGSTDFTARV